MHPVYVTFVCKLGAFIYFYVVHLLSFLCVCVSGFLVGLMVKKMDMISGLELSIV